MTLLFNYIFANFLFSIVFPSLPKLDCPEAEYVDQADLNLRDTPVFVSGVLRLKDTG